MPGKPTANTKWALSATKTEPSSGQKDAGWSVGQKPAAQWHNWWMDAVDQWKVWLAAFESTVHTWTALQTFDAGLTVSNGDLTVSTGKLMVPNNVSDNVLGPTQIDGLFTANFDAGIGGDLSLGGGITQSAGSNVLKDTQVQGNLDVDADLAVGDDLTVTGDAAVTGVLTPTGGIAQLAYIAVGSGGAPAFLNSWVNQGGTSPPAAYWKDREGKIHIRGLITGGSSITTAFILPVGYRPAYDHTFICAADLSNRQQSINVFASTGIVQVVYSTSFSGPTSLECCFRTD